MADPQAAELHQREAALLAKSWGITQKLIVQGITGSAMYFTNFEGLYAAFEALDDILDEEEARI